MQNCCTPKNRASNYEYRRSLCGTNLSTLNVFEVVTCVEFSTSVSVGHTENTHGIGRLIFRSRCEPGELHDEK